MSKYNTNNIKSIITIKPYFLINWHCTGWCNFHCPYCINRKWKSGWISEERKIQEAIKINELIKKSNITQPISFRLIGGEPGFYNWPKILEYIERIDKIIIVTNLSNTLDYYKTFYEYCYKRKINLFFGASKHEESVNFDDKIIELTNWCKEHNYSQPQLTVIADENFDMNYINFLEKNGLNRIRISLLRNDYQYNSISDRIKKQVIDYNKKYELARHGYKQFEVTFMDGTKEQFVNASDITNLMDDGGFNPEGFYCSSGQTTISIIPSSDVVKNKCDFLKDEILGNLLTDDIIIPSEPELCQINKKYGTKDRCCSICSGTNFIRKEK